MKRIETIQGIVEYLLHRHPQVRQTTGGGVSCFKTIKKKDGTRSIFETTSGFRIIKYDIIDDNSLTIDQLASGYHFKGSHKVVQTSKLFLTDLIAINVYDYRAEFFSFGIDFVYLVKDPSSKTQLMNDWVNQETGILRAQWVHKDEDVEKMLDEISFGRKIIVHDEFSSRPILMDDDE